MVVLLDWSIPEGIENSAAVLFLIPPPFSLKLAVSKLEALIFKKPFVKVFPSILMDFS
ncbi:hypothetical protein ACCC68_07220 [Tenacibaculum maritimum]|uniref:hypothetical protein n=1 Tax=Tenacibaculum maritimum TaxID=107401 RepID=UPI00352B8670